MAVSIPCFLRLSVMPALYPSEQATARVLSEPLVCEAHQHRRAEAHAKIHPVHVMTRILCHFGSGKGSL